MEAGSDDASPAWSVAALIDRIASFMSDNEAACTLRMLNIFTSTVLRGRTTVRMSKPSPPHAFARRWGTRDAMRPLSCKQRQKLLSLTAGSGSVVNLQLALAWVACAPTPEAFSAAAAAGHLLVCEELLQHGCPWSPDVLDAAARAGLLDSVAWLLRAGCPPGPQLLAVAAGAGHSELCEWMVAEAGLVWSAEAARAAACGGFQALFEQVVAQLGDAAMARPYVVGELLKGAAEGCDLATLMWMHRTWIDAEDTDHPDQADAQGGPAGGAQVGQQQQQQRLTLSNRVRGAVVAAAAASRTPDWRAKVEWLLARGYPRDCDACRFVVALPEALERLAWLCEPQQAFTPNNHFMSVAMAKAQRLDVLDALQAQAPSWVANVAGAAEDADLEFLRALHARGARLRGARCITHAARRGSVEAVEWLLETCSEDAAAAVGGGGGRSAGGIYVARLTAEVFAVGAASGSVEMAAWLRERGCAWDVAVFAEAASAGCEEQLEWLAARGCPIGDDGEPYVRAARNGDMTTLQLLRRLRCPWGPPGNVFTAAVAWASGLSVLSWLLDAGCPVDWDTAAEAASMRQRPPGVEQWLEQQRRARQWRLRCVVQ